MIPREWQESFAQNLAALKSLAGQIPVDLEARRRALERDGAALFLRLKQSAADVSAVDITAWMNRARALANDLRARAQPAPPPIIARAMEERLSDAVDMLASSPWTWISVGLAALLVPSLFEDEEDDR
jgi:hypothetical protein